MASVAVKACLFDMDGTLLDSHRSFDRIWGRWAERNGLDYAKVAKDMHGGRAVDMVRRFAPHCPDPEREAREQEALELVDLADTVAIRGAKAFLDKLPAASWTIVTSAIRELAERRLRAAGLPVPHMIVAAEDVAEGKPSPAGYLMAAERLGCAPAACAIFEDAITGIEAAAAAGGRVFVIASGHDRSPVAVPSTAHPTVRSFDEIDVRATADGLILDW